MTEQTVAQTTADELLAMPHNGYRYELVQGELRQMAPAGRQHGRIAANFIGSLIAFVKKNNLGEVHSSETGFIIDTAPDTVRAPDVSFVARERAEATAEERGFFPGAPDLAVEVISPNDRYSEIEEKVSDWLRAGTQMVVVIDPHQRTATVYRASRRYLHSHRRRHARWRRCGAWVENAACRRILTAHDLSSSGFGAV